MREIMKTFFADSGVKAIAAAISAREGEECGLKFCPINGLIATTDRGGEQVIVETTLLERAELLRVLARNLARA